MSSETAMKTPGTSHFALKSGYVRRRNQGIADRAVPQIPRLALHITPRLRHVDGDGCGVIGDGDKDRARSPAVA